MQQATHQPVRLTSSPAANWLFVLPNTSRGLLAVMSTFLHGRSQILRNNASRSCIVRLPNKCIQALASFCLIELPSTWMYFSASLRKKPRKLIVSRLVHMRTSILITHKKIEFGPIRNLSPASMFNNPNASELFMSVGLIPQWAVLMYWYCFSSHCQSQQGFVYSKVTES